jgi:hypothetical protein
MTNNVIPGFREMDAFRVICAPAVKTVTSLNVDLMISGSDPKVKKHEKRNRIEKIDFMLMSFIYPYK